MKNLLHISTFVHLLKGKTKAERYTTGTLYTHTRTHTLK